MAMSTMKLAGNSHIMMTAEEFQTLKMSEVSDIIYNRVESKLRAWCGDKAKILLSKYADRPFKDVANCSSIDFTDCYEII